jgi:hypothetical protein
MKTLIAAGAAALLWSAAVFVAGPLYGNAPDMWKRQ